MTIKEFFKGWWDSFMDMSEQLYGSKWFGIIGWFLGLIETVTWILLWIFVSFKVSAIFAIVLTTVSWIISILMFYKHMKKHSAN